MLKDEIEKKNQLKKDFKTIFGLTCQIHDPGHKTEITQWKINLNKLQISITNQHNVEWWD
jgi:hypothetical protein